MSGGAGILTKRSAFIIYGWLILLTLFEVGIVFMGMERLPGAILLGGTTLAKMLLIGLFFMHVKYDHRLAWFLPGIPVALAIFFVTMLFPDLVFHLPLMFR
jgi:caa(3)-type oxidase subunit IV